MPTAFVVSKYLLANFQNNQCCEKRLSAIITVFVSVNIFCCYCCCNFVLFYFLLNYCYSCMNYARERWWIVSAKGANVASSKNLTSFCCCCCYCQKMCGQIIIEIYGVPICCLILPQAVMYLCTCHMQHLVLQQWKRHNVNKTADKIQTFFLHLWKVCPLQN